MNEVFDVIWYVNMCDVIDIRLMIMVPVMQAFDMLDCIQLISYRKTHWSIFLRVFTTLIQT